ncbi:MAG: hypothetical protein A3G76_10770 [Acidobacteria bacterium RIFCSPLOWO2_12_FULL_65_11]|nr:MAG: hypothetical protein A3H95_00225 [Acidobacteria bacterium RIFCSPLOWO2_02_FULL_64_15]OFW29684.1 MAG: hypothetical protein A3G76_10770 [Acidobacteria bacterium RIFCSPLOWO2_12_FULL_65_11]
MLVSFANWIHATPLGWAVGGGVPWLWPACETAHFIGLALLLGCVGLFDLRMIGMAKGLELGPLQRLVPWGVFGFVLNVITGVMFFAGKPYQYLNNYVFWLKMLFVALAGINVLLFYATGLQRRVEAVGAGEHAPAAARVVAAVSLLLWFGVVYWGRMLPFLGTSF